MREGASEPGADDKPAVEPGRLFVDFIEPASDLSLALSVLESAVVEPRGLSVLGRAPGIFERMEPRKERMDSLVSDFEKDGYDCSGSPEPALPLECVWPMAARLGFLPSLAWGEGLYGRRAFQPQRRERTPWMLECLGFHVQKKMELDDKVY